MPAPHSAPRPRVVITGLGLITALGQNQVDTWRNLRAGRHGFRTLDLEYGPGAPCFAGAPLLAARSATTLLAEAATEALADGKLDLTAIDRERAAVVLGLSKGEPQALGRFHQSGFDGDWLSGWPHSGASAVSRALDFRGPCLAPIAACATGLIAALRAADLIRQGRCDLALAGAADASLDPFLLGAFRRMGVLARTTTEPARAVRPWDRARSGFLVGEGAAVLLLERLDHARARGALACAELVGGEFGADAFHETALNPDPSNLAGLIGRALSSSSVETSEIDHVNVHGTATRTNDPLECRALRLALGPHADRIACSANKAQIGHTLGAAGAVELAIMALAVRDGFVPPTLNLDDSDDGCDLDGTPHSGRPMPIRAALKLSLGFGGHLAAAILRQVES